LARPCSGTADDPQAWLTRATVLRVLGRYDEAAASCQKLKAWSRILASRSSAPQGFDGSDGPSRKCIREDRLDCRSRRLPPEARAWRYSELGEMAERRGDDAPPSTGCARDCSSRRMISTCAPRAPICCCGSKARAEVLQLLSRLRIHGADAIAYRHRAASSCTTMSGRSKAVAQLAGAFDIEQQRGDAVHRREQARFLLDVSLQPSAALTAAQQNWQVQREPEDVLVLLRAAQAAQHPQAAEPAH
jgi:hypothetical protein